jgi:hypothetical protein
LRLAGEFHSSPKPSIELSRRISFVSISIFSSNPTNPKMPRPKSLRETKYNSDRKIPQNSLAAHCYRLCAKIKDVEILFEIIYVFFFVKPSQKHQRGII